MSTPHQIINPATLAEPVGFAHAVEAAAGRTIYLGGQAAHDRDGRIVGASMAEQFDRAAANVVTALEGAGARAEHLVSLQIYVTDVAEYRDALDDLATAYKRSFGRHYPAIALFEVAGLFDPDAKVELVCIAVVPDDDPTYRARER
ncbi:MAG: RidA family protein [Actinomycetota bacterium]|nr:RidA family protein [Actinomycetota bacterium]